MTARPPAPLAITPAQDGDAAELHALQMLAFAEEGRICGTTDIPPLTETAAHIEHLIAQHCVRVLRQDGRIVASARGVMSGDTCRVQGVFVDPARQGQGIGAALVRAVEAAHPQARRFELTTNTLVPGNVRFYQGLGYRVDHTTVFNGHIVLAEMVKDQAPENRTSHA